MGIEADLDDDFDGWSSRYNDYYPAGSRGDAEFRASRLLLVNSRAWGHRIDTILTRRTGQNRARWKVLFALAFARQPATLSEIAHRSTLHWPSLVRVVEQLEGEGMLELADNPADGRSKLVSLTPEGDALVQMVQEALDSERAALLAKLSMDELRQFASLLGKVNEGLREASGKSRRNQP